MFMGFSLKKLVCGVKGVQARCERDGRVSLGPPPKWVVVAGQDFGPP